MRVILSSYLAVIFWKTVYGEPLTLQEQQQWDEWQQAHPDETYHSIFRSEMQLVHEVESTSADSLEDFWKLFDERFPGQRTVPGR